MQMLSLEHACLALESRIVAACVRAGRSRDRVLLLPAPKRQSPEAIQSLYDLGLRHLGESRVQEFLPKKDDLPADIHWHFIGHLQSNKARQIAGVVQTVHSVDTLQLATELSRRAEQHS